MMIIELDTVAGEGEYAGENGTAADAAKVITAGYNVAWEVVTEHGPAGGNPILRFAGPEDELRRMVTEHYGADTEL